MAPQGTALPNWVWTRSVPRSEAGHQSLVHSDDSDGVDVEVDGAPAAADVVVAVFVAVDSAALGDSEDPRILSDPLEYQASDPSCSKCPQRL